MDDSRLVRVLLDSTVATAGGVFVYWALTFGPYMLRSIIDGMLPLDAFVILIPTLVFSFPIAFLVVCPIATILKKYDLYKPLNVFGLSALFAIVLSNLILSNWHNFITGYIFPSISGLVFGQIHLLISKEPRH